MADLAESRKQFEAGKSRPIEELDPPDGGPPQ